MRQELTPIQAEYVGRSLTTQSQAPINIVVNAQPATAVSGRSGLSVTLLSFMGAFFIGIIIYSAVTGTPLAGALQQLENTASQWINNAKEYVSGKL
mgnify:CR=1 FL=1